MEENTQHPLQDRHIVAVGFFALFFLAIFVVGIVRGWTPPDSSPSQGAGKIYRNPGNNFVGINTPTPANALSISGTLSIATTTTGAALSAATNGLSLEVALGIGTSTIFSPLSLSGGGITIDGIQQRYDRNAKIPLPHVITSFAVAGDVQTSAFTVNRDGTPIFFYTLDYSLGDKNIYALRCREIDCSSVDTPVVAFTIPSQQKDPEVLSAKPGPGDYPMIIIRNKGAFSGTVSRFIACGSLNCDKNTAPGNTVTLMGSDIESADMIIGGDGNPIIISIVFGFGNPIDVIHCLNVTCSNKENLTLVDGNFDDLAFTLGIDNFPIIAYRDQDIDALKFIKCRTTSCSSSSDPVTLYAPSGNISSVGELNAITVSSDGAPIIFHKSQGSSGNPSESNLFVTKCDNTSCTATSTDVMKKFSSGTTVTSIRSATGVHGTPIIVYSTTESGNNLYFIRCGNAFCGKDAFDNSEFKETRLVLTGAYYVGFPTNEFYSEPGANVFIGSHGLPLVGFINSLSGSGLLTSFQCGSEFCIPYWTRR